MYKRQVGGGRVLDPNAPDRKRRAPARMQWLQGVADMLAGGGLQPLLAQAALGLDETALQRLAGRPVRDLAAPDGAIWIEPRTPQGARTLILATRCV